jgi:hydroxyacylglutathione hydrolase
VRVGIDTAVGHLALGLPTWINAGLPLASVTQVSASKMPKGALILDVRTEAEWQTGHISGSQHVMLGDLESSVAGIDASREVLVLCGSGYRSSIAASLLTADGFEKVSSLAGGMSAYKKLGLPLVK